MQAVSLPQAGRSMTYIEEGPQPSILEIQMPGAMPQAAVEQDFQPFWNTMN